MNKFQNYKELIKERNGKIRNKIKVIIEVQLKKLRKTIIENLESQILVINPFPC
jgi:hypothetical protein